MIPEFTCRISSITSTSPKHLTPRTEIVEINGDYLHAEVTSKWMKYVDDLEVTFLPKPNILLIRSESRVGEGDLGVNQKRVDLLKSKMF